MVKLTCLGCGKTFDAYPCEVRQGRKYCSRACADSSAHARAAKSMRVSAAWSNPDTRSRIMAGIAERSEDPVWKSAPHFQKGPAHPAYKGQKRPRNVGCSRYPYIQWRNAVFQRDGYTCQECGARGVRINAHHIKPWADAPELRYDIANGITLCAKCHGELHGRTAIPPYMTCGHCGKRFPYTRSSRLFCSLDCAHAHHKTSVTITCPVCDKQFAVWPSRLGKTKCGLNFCSSTCKEEWYRAHR